MTNLIRFRSVLVAASLLAGSAACTQKSETRREADRAAEAVEDQIEDLKEESRDLAKTAKDDDVEEIADDAKDVGEHARELANASNEFRYRKMVRIQTLRAVHAVEASQPMLINAFAQALPLVEKDRGEVNERLVIFQMRLDEAGNAIQSLELVDAKDWEARDDAVSKALERVEAAREDVWESLREAERTGDRTSMR